MAWLSGWAKRRIKLTIDHTDIDSVLSNFPILVYLSASSGYNNVDVSCVFDELQSDANRKKIAVTQGDGTTQCYVEVEKWDNASERAWLWVKVPSVASGVGTELYLYYDKIHTDNTDYVGDPSDAVVHNVWGASFVLVSHMRDDPDTSHVRDSTVNANDGTKKAAGAPAVTTAGRIDSAQDFETDNDEYIEFDYDPSLKMGAGSFTVSFWFKPETLPSGTHALFQYNVSGYADGFLVSQIGNNLSIYIQSGGASHSLSNYFLDETGNEIFVTIVFDASANEILGYKNGNYVSKATDKTWNITVEGASRVGYTQWAGSCIDGVYDELRILKEVACSAAWIKASYESERDHLLNFGSEELSPLFETYGQRIKLTIDHTKIDSTLSWFPVTVFFTSSQGGEIFTEFDADTDYMKIAFTTSDEVTQLYAECELFDVSENKAIYHVSKSGWNISDSVDTVFYMYYDNDAADNTTYIGVKGLTGRDGPRENVWDGNHKMVQHKNDETTSTITDSTLNNNDGTKKGANEPIEATGKVGQAQDFDGEDDYIDTGITSIPLPLTISAWVKTIASGAIITKQADFYFESVANKLGWYVASGWKYSTTTITDDAFHFVAISLDVSGNGNLYVNGNQETAITEGKYGSNANKAFIGARLAGSYLLAAIIDEVRIENIVRTASWIKAAYNSGNDSLLTYGPKRFLTSTAVITTSITGSLSRGIKESLISTSAITSSITGRLTRIVNLASSSAIVTSITSVLSRGITQSLTSTSAITTSITSSLGRGIKAVLNSTVNITTSTLSVLGRGIKQTLASTANIVSSIISTLTAIYDWIKVTKKESDFNEVTKEVSNFTEVDKEESDWTKTDKGKGDWEKIDKG